MSQTGKTNGTDVSNVYDMFVTKAGGPKVCLVFRWDCNDFANGGCRQEGHLESVCEVGETGLGGGARERAYDEIL